MTKIENDIAHANIKAVYRYLEAIETELQAKPPILKKYTEGECEN